MLLGCGWEKGAAERCNSRCDDSHRLAGKPQAGIKA
jgi:hypothetical protein